MKYIFNIILSIFSVVFIVSCKEDKTRAEAQRRINESEITIYSNKDLSKLRINDYIYLDYTQDSRNNHQSFFNSSYYIKINLLIEGLQEDENCTDIFQNDLKCYKIIDKEIKFNYSMQGSFFGCRKYTIFCAPQSVQADPKIYTFTLK